MSQLPLSLSLPPIYTEENFFISDCNRDAHHMVMAWPRWPGQNLLLYGPKGSGKTHLGQIWAKRTGALVWPATGLDAMEYPLAMPGLIENIERTRDERLLLHLINHARERGLSLLLTANAIPQHLPFVLPDLTSRLLAMNSISIAQPDDGVLAGAMRKQFADRQMKVDDDVIDYTLPRMERSLEKVREIVDLVDKSTLETQKSVTIPFIRKLLDKKE